VAKNKQLKKKYGERYPLLEDKRKTGVSLLDAHTIV